MRFTKMEGCGNDYVYIDGARERIPDGEKPEFVRRLSDRHFGVGGDGVIFIHPAPDGEADFEMEMYNADGSRAQMCGNGIRCVGKYVYDSGLTDKRELAIVSMGSVKYLKLEVAGAKGTAPGDSGVPGAVAEEKGAGAGSRGEVIRVRVDMGSPILTPAKIPAKFPGEQAVDVPLFVRGKEYRTTCVSMGNPHAVIFVEDTASLDILTIGPDFEHHEAFPERVNTEFVQILDRQNVNMRVWERGTGETLACGTGACASVVACVLNGRTDERVTVHLLGGDLEVEWDREKDTVYMTGPAVKVFDGEIG